MFSWQTGNSLVSLFNSALALLVWGKKYTYLKGLYTDITIFYKIDYKLYYDYIKDKES